MIEQIQINDWRQFDNLTIDFDKRLTILTGANGSGKTTILNILSKAFGESVKFVSNVSETADGSIDYTSSVIGDLEEKRDSNYKSSVIGNITYNSTTSSILVPEQVSTTYNIDLKRILNHVKVYTSTPIVLYFSTKKSTISLRMR